MIQEIPTVFISQGVPLVGTFFRQPMPLDERQPCVVVTGSWLNVKEQMATTYARALAAQGFTAFTFDFANWGESGGELRHAELPSSKVKDIRSAAAFASTHSFVEAGRVAHLGICAGAQYGLRAAAEGAPIASLAAIAGWFHDAGTIAPFYDGARGVALRLGRAAEALAAFRATRELRMVPAYAPGDDRAGMHFELPYYAEKTRGAVPAWKNEMAELSWLHWLSYDGLTPSRAVRTPMMMVHGDGCALPDNARRVHEQLSGRKQIAWLGGTQTDYYDQSAYVDDALSYVVPWLEETLT